MATSVEFSVRWTFDQFYHSRLLYLGRGRLGGLLQNLLGFLVLFLVSWRIYSAGPDLVGVLGLLAVSYVLGGRTLLVWFESRRLWKDFGDYGLDWSYHFDSKKGLTVTPGATEGEEPEGRTLPWSELRAWKENESYILIIAREGGFFSLSKEEGSETKIESLRGQLRHHLGEPLPGKIRP